MADNYILGVLRDVDPVGGSTVILENYVLDYDTSECRGVTLALYKFLTLEERLQKNLVYYQNKIVLGFHFHFSKTLEIRRPWQVSHQSPLLQEGMAILLSCSHFMFANM